MVLGLGFLSPSSLCWVFVQQAMLWGCAGSGVLPAPVASTDLLWDGQRGLSDPAGTVASSGVPAVPGAAVGAVCSLVQQVRVGGSKASAPNPLWLLMGPGSKSGRGSV